MWWFIKYTIHAFWSTGRRADGSSSLPRLSLNVVSGKVHLFNQDSLFETPGKAETYTVQIWTLLILTPFPFGFTLQRWWEIEMHYQTGWFWMRNSWGASTADGVILPIWDGDLAKDEENPLSLKWTLLPAFTNKFIFRGMPLSTEPLLQKPAPEQRAGLWDIWRQRSNGTPVHVLQIQNGPTDQMAHKQWTCLNVLGTSSSWEPACNRSMLMS